MRIVARPKRLIIDVSIWMALWTVSPALPDPGDLVLVEVASGIGQPLTALIDLP